jgi:hypothetical protein
MPTSQIASSNGRIAGARRAPPAPAERSPFPAEDAIGARGGRRAPPAWSKEVGDP